MTDEPQQAMMAERLAEMRARMEAIPGSIFVQTQHELSQTFFDRNELVEAMEYALSEVERLRAREAALLALVAFAWRVASDHEHKWRGDHCKYCDVEYSSWTAQAQIEARALLAAQVDGEQVEIRYYCQPCVEREWQRLAAGESQPCEDCGHTPCDCDQMRAADDMLYGGEDESAYLSDDDGFDEPHGDECCCEDCLQDYPERDALYNDCAFYGVPSAE